MALSVTRDGVELVYETAGHGDPAMMFVHGWSCDRSYFAPQLEHFATRHRVAGIDLRGHGESDRPTPDQGVYLVETFAEDVLCVARAASLDRPIVVGHSLGALIALACATRPETVRAAVMIDSAPLINSAVKDFLGEAVHLVEADEDGSWRAGFANGWFLPTDSTRRDEIIHSVSTFSSNIAAASLRAIAQFDGAAALGAVNVPLLSIGSAVPTDSPGDLRDACPNITIGQTVGAGHFNHLEVPDQVNMMIEQFLAINDL